MFIAINDNDNTRVLAEKADKSLSFHCPLCGQPVVCKQGRKRIWHFAHTKGSDCDQDFKTPDMSEWHRCRQSLFHPRCQEVSVVDKETGEKHRADVLIYNKYVIEFQHSKISSEEFDRRNEFYTRCGYKVVWVFDLSSVSDHLTPWYYTNIIHYKWKWSWRTWENCDLECGDVVLLIELEEHSRNELLQKPCWLRVLSGVWNEYNDDLFIESPPSYYQTFNEFRIHKYELVNRMAFKTPEELNKLTSHCPECGRLIHKYKLKSSYGFYFKCYHGHGK